LDLSRVANVTQQSLLELTLEAYTHDALQKSIGQTELVLNAIPPSHQPSEMTKFTWLYSRLKSCRAMIHGMGRLYGKLQGTVIEMREDANEESIRNALSPSRNKPKSNPKGDGKDKAAVAQGGKGNAKLDDAKTEPALAVVKAKPKGGGQDKGRDKGKGPGKGKQKGGSKTPRGKALGGPPAKQCHFYLSCNRGDACPFAHEDSSATKARAQQPRPHLPRHLLPL